MKQVIDPEAIEILLFDTKFRVGNARYTIEQLLNVTQDRLSTAELNALVAACAQLAALEERITLCQRSGGHRRGRAILVESSVEGSSAAAICDTDATSPAKVAAL